MLHYKTFEACVAVDDIQLEEYGVEVFEEENKVTCWIASEAGKQFAVKWQATVGDNSKHIQGKGVAGLVMLDGVKCGGRLIPSVHGQRRVETITADSVAISRTSVRSFLFSHLSLTGMFHVLLVYLLTTKYADDEEYLHSAPKGLGEIQLDFWDVLGSGECPMPDRDVRTGEEKIHERSKKAMTHCVKFGEARPSASQNVAMVKYLNPKPFATFVFKYRASGMLRANGIIPTRAGEKRPADEEPAVEIIDEVIHDIKNEQDGDLVYDEYSRQIQAMKDKVKELEEKRSKTKSRPTKKVKTESRPSKVFQSGEIIDLT
ncbi:hypothetical protein SERLA73DRAFT_181362 [Serpula lacrymans var. lacrymans S7.3]|uniref:DUF7918 domain-containing protein n=2 Tax=Serpula lacrymans var. lacrymans TaxID=341189 RepID=F8PXX9_SERL3|nr:uncharacterized protein SERLADRAFT_467473 [Serpula lacrymans var. lacrymans S7.9]EGN98742.1 hypothetical protein SERLA73DRAFT_181362 [Serpula lacrymans var. lacrymans S7.3]EGO24340.1 hypothetical protein SERLADRAFT_467473 [Serpula lacrymans var. lacrymans S7.9]